MRVAVISDIHSNLAALEAVLADADRRGVDEVWCVGDIVGYGPEPSACLAIVRDRASVCIAGNHDLGVAGQTARGSTGSPRTEGGGEHATVDLAWFNEYALAAIRWTARTMSPEEKRYLGSLPPVLAHGRYTLAHGSPREPVWEYVVTSQVARVSFDAFEGDVCFVGHSHIPFVCREAESPRLQHANDGVDTPLGATRWIVNPGSVGQPRDGDPRASYAILDTDRGVLTHHRVAYDIAKTQARMREARLPSMLIERLSVGE
ncbi:MAG: metallophosphoesterase family protein [Chloroflexi bacterium]|nr:metallophosphoesterase family protein [Chloroflexota bacterium]